MTTATRWSLLRRALLSSTTTTTRTTTTAVEASTTAVAASVRMRTRKPYRAWTPEEDARIVQLVAKHGDRQWRTVAAELGISRTGRSVQQRWQTALDPALVARDAPWTREEDEQLRRLVDLHGEKWSFITSQLGGKRPVWKIRRRYMAAVGPLMNAGEWLPSEEQRLVEAMSRVGAGGHVNWREIAEHVGTRDEHQCHFRWRNFAPHLKQGPLTPEEDKQLEKLVKKHGETWHAFGRMMNRSPMLLYKRYHRHLEPARREVASGTWAKDEIDRLMTAFEQYGPDWQRVSDHVKTRTAERCSNILRGRFRTVYDEWKQKHASYVTVPKRQQQQQPRQKQ